MRVFVKSFRRERSRRVALAAAIGALAATGFAAGGVYDGAAAQVSGPPANRATEPASVDAQSGSETVRSGGGEERAPSLGEVLRRQDGVERRGGGETAAGASERETRETERTVETRETPPTAQGSVGEERTASAEGETELDARNAPPRDGTATAVVLPAESRTDAPRAGQRQERRERQASLQTRRSPRDGTVELDSETRPQTSEELGVETPPRGQRDTAGVLALELSPAAPPTPSETGAERLSQAERVWAIVEPNFRSLDAVTPARIDRMRRLLLPRIQAMLDEAGAALESAEARFGETAAERAARLRRLEQLRRRVAIAEALLDAASTQG